MTKIHVLDNGSAGSKLLQEEYKDQYDIDVIKVNNADSLVEQFTKVDNKDRIKIFLPFTVQDLVAYNEKLRREIREVEALGFKNLIVLPYEGRDTKEVEFLVNNLSKKGQTLQDKDFDEPSGTVEEFDFDPDKDVIKDEDKPYKSIRTNRKVY